MAKEYYKHYPTTSNDGSYMLSYDEHPNNSHPLIKRGEYGVFMADHNGRQRMATYELSSGKMFVANDSTKLFGGGDEMTDTKQIEDKKLRTHFEKMLPKFKSYRDALVAHCNTEDFKNSPETRKAAILAWRQITDGDHKLG